MNNYPNSYYQQNQTQSYQPSAVQNNGALGWDDEIQQENSFVILPAGDYRFEILKFERSHFDGNEKISSCPKAIVTFKIFAPDGTITEVKENYLLHDDMKWKLCEFFSGVGMQKKDEKIRMCWTSELIGKTGICKVVVRKYKNRNGEDREINNIEKLYPAYNMPDLQSPAPAYQPPRQGYQPKKG